MASGFAPAWCHTESIAIHPALSLAPSSGTTLLLVRQSHHRIGLGAVVSLRLALLCQPVVCCLNEQVVVAWAPASSAGLFKENVIGWSELSHCVWLIRACFIPPVCSGFAAALLQQMPLLAGLNAASMGVAVCPQQWPFPTTSVGDRDGFLLTRHGCW